LDCLSGYLTAREAVNVGFEIPIVMNFGPDPSNVRTVGEVLELIRSHYPQLELKIEVARANLKETQLLTLDSSLAATKLRWKNLIGFERAVELTMAEFGANDAKEVSMKQVRDFVRIREAT
jgi:hypothetical protein